jgi:hypothetical protein
VLWPFLVVLAVTSSPAVTAYTEFRHIAARPLWPGFEPLATPIEVFDGRRTYLFAHPTPPAGFQPADAGTFVYEGRHETVRANTGTPVNGVATATADLSTERPTRTMAALLLHETFHVYQRKAHPTWSGNEADLFTYPLEDSAALAGRRLETAAWVHALEESKDATARAWARTALAQRATRFQRLPAAAAAYERGTELNEGLAQFVEFKSIERAPAITAVDFPLEDVRSRAYATGQAMAVLLDRFAPGWESAMDTTALDEVLSERLGKGEQAPFRPEEIAAVQARAHRDVGALLEARRSKESEYRSAPGFSLEFVASKEPLWPQGFDPLNVTMLGKGEVLHTRWIKLGNGSGTCEVLGRPSLTEAAGEHPLFQGVRRLVVTGLTEPMIVENGGTLTIEGGGIKASLKGTVERSGQAWIIRMP